MFIIDGTVAAGIPRLLFVIFLVPEVTLGYGCNGHESNGGQFPAEIEEPSSKPPLWNSFRLPTFARPLHYEIFLHPDRERMEFFGRVEIRIQIMERTSFLVLHAKDINFDFLTVKLQPSPHHAEATGSSHEILAKMGDAMPHPRHDQLHIELKKTVEAGSELSLSAEYRGLISNHPFGLYLTKSRNREVIGTQMEPNGARRVFPCWDEPMFRAKCTLSLVRSKNLTALSNMPLRLSAIYGNNSETIRDEFLTTPRISTYLVTFAIGEFAEVSARLSNETGTFVSVYIPQDQRPKARLAFESSSKLMRFFEDFFRVPYPLAKLDIVALPGFVYGGMENWGMVTVEYGSVLADEFESSERQKQSILQTMADEISHQWVGDLVAVKWWNDLWMKEGCATWLQYKGADFLEPDWGISDHFFASEMTRALRYDSLESSRPLSPPDITSTESILELYDELTFSKGAAVMRMLEGVMGLKAMRKSWKFFLEEFSFGNADNRDLLWTSLGTFAGLGPGGLKNFSRVWVEKQGYPLVELSLDEDGNLVATQRRFSYSDPACYKRGQRETPHEENLSCEDVWQIPLICFVGLSDGGQAMIEIWLSSSASDGTPLHDDFKYVKCNAHGMGFYRVSYPEELWESLLQALDHHPRSFHRLDRASIISDAFALTWFRGRPWPIEFPLELAISLLPGENDFVVWSTALDELFRISNSLRSPEVKDKFDAFVSGLMMPIYRELGWENSGTHEEKMLRELVVETMLDLDSEDAESKALREFNRWRASVERSVRMGAAGGGGSLIHGLAPELRIAVWTAGIRKYGKQAFRTCLKLYRTTLRHSHARKDLLVALARAAGTSELAWLLRQSTNGNFVPLDDVSAIISNAVRNPNGGVLVVWRFMKENWSIIYEVLPSFELGMVIREFLSSFLVDEGAIQELEEFLDSVGGARKVGRFVKQEIELARLNFWWAAKYEQVLENWLDELVNKTERLHFRVAIDA